MKRVAIVCLGLAGAHGCAMSHDVGGSDTSLLLPIELDAQCLRELEDSPSGLPTHLSCTGLYNDTAAREVADGVVGYSPAYRLWSDGLNKERFVFLPEGTKIDASDPSGWRYPVGTRFWKEFQEPSTGRPIETRLYFKKSEGDWKQSTYEWNASHTDATRIAKGKEITVAGERWFLPGSNDCEDCHKGRRDRVLGFEQVALGLAGATGETLGMLVEQDRLENFDGVREYHIGPDDESVEAHALGWLHMNCGVTCHNENANSGGQSLDLRLRLDPEQLDGRSTQSFPAVVTTLGKSTQTLRWLGNTRVVAGAPEQSWLYTLISQRGDLNQQMPPLGTYVTDPDGTQWVRQWIEQLPDR